MNGRSLVCALTSALLLLAQLHIWGASGCSMCGATCRCASRASGDSCTVRSMGCGGGDGGAVLGSISPSRAVLVALDPFAPPSALGRALSIASRLSPHPARPPLDPPPRVSG